MIKSDANWIVLGALLGFCAILLGAGGSHWFDSLLSEKGKETYTIGFRFHIVHVILIFVVTIMKSLISVDIKALKFCLWFFFLGIMLFSGSLYALGLSGISYFGMIAPIGGLFFMIGWLCLVYAGFIIRSNRTKGDDFD